MDRKDRGEKIDSPLYRESLEGGFSGTSSWKRFAFRPIPGIDSIEALTYEDTTAGTL